VGYGVATFARFAGAPSIQIAPRPFQLRNIDTEPHPRPTQCGKPR
jgi:hypothetical protein